MAAITHRLRCETLETRLLAADLNEPLLVTLETPDITGLRAAEIELQYDPASLNITADDIRAGKAWGERASIVSNVDPAAGTVSIFLFSVEPVKVDQGELLDLRFEVSDVVVEDVAAVSLSKLRLNEGELAAPTRVNELNDTRGEVSDAQVMLACSPWISSVTPAN